MISGSKVIFVKDMYIAFLYNYLDCAVGDSSNLLHCDLKRENFNTKRIAEKILTMLNEVKYDEFGNFLKRALIKENFDVISVLIVNSAPLFSYSQTDNKAKENLNKLMQKSFQTIMIDVHNLLFNFNKFYADVNVDVNLLSSFPNRDGSYKESCKDNITLKGTKKHQAVLAEVKKFIDEVEQLIEKGGLNRVREYARFMVFTV